MNELYLKDKTVLLGVSGSIAAYKSALLASKLLKMGANVHVAMTKNATEFISPLTFSTYTGNKTLVDTFDNNFEYEVGHVSIAQKSDVVIVAPATANLIAKMANGIADDMLTTTLLATKAPIIVSPAMNTNMYENPATQHNLKVLRDRGIQIVEPDSGMLACKVEGKGKMPEPDVLAEYVLYTIAREKSLSGKKVVVSAGPTRESIDPVRFISNHSTGKMGYAIAHEAAMMGADVVLVSGPVSLETPLGVKRIDVVSAKDMEEAVVKESKNADIIVMSAAVADFTPVEVAKEKIKKKDTKDSAINLTKTTDILAKLGKIKKDNQFICGFSMETENVLENSTKKLESKNADMIVANDLRREGAGFATDTNIVTLITKEGAKELPLMSKEEVAHKILLEAVNHVK